MHEDDAPEADDVDEMDMTLKKKLRERIYFFQFNEDHYLPLDCDLDVSGRLVELTLLLLLVTTLVWF